MNIVPKLNLNKHPKDCENLSLTLAKNMMISGDMSCLTNEPGIKDISSIDDRLSDLFSGKWKIVGYIPCNDEVVLFINGRINGENSQNHIFRYREKDDYLYLFGSNWQWSGGKIKGTFTYNVENDLIISVAEYGIEGKDIPLKTINLGHFDVDGAKTIVGGDLDLSDGKLAISPELKLPSFSTVNYIAGSCYKGWHYIYIRFKINEVDYTQWFHIGYPIFMDTYERTQIMRYAFGAKPGYTSGNTILSDWPTDGFCNGCFDDISSTGDVASNTFEVVINTNNIVDNFEYYQIGIVCASKQYTKSWRTSDIKVIKDATTQWQSQSYIFDIQQLVEVDLQSFIEENYNYFNVRNIINYKNRLYISNYKEHSLNNKKIDQSIIDSINVKLYSNNGALYGPILDSNIKYCITFYNPNAQTSPLQYFVPYSRISNGTSMTVAEFLHLPYGTIRKAGVSVDNVTFNCVDTDLSRIYLRAKSSGGVTSIPANVEFYNSILGTTGTVLRVYTDPNDGKYYFEVNVSNWLMASVEKVYDNAATFESRRTRTTLLPNEVYNFFIHFVDKYGHVTNGYRLENKKTYIDPVSGKNCVPLPINFTSSTSQNQDVFYTLVPEDTTFSNINSAITNNILYRVSDDGSGYVDLDLTSPFTNRTLNQIKTVVNKIYNTFIGDSDYSNLRIYQVINTAIGENFGIYINNNGDRLHRIPKKKFHIDPDYQWGYHSFYTYGIYVDVPQLPDGYVGWFISYEKFEPIQRVTGFLTRNDFRTISKIKGSNGNVQDVLDTANCKTANTMFLYSSKFDISDSIKLDYNVLEIELKGGYTPEIRYYDSMSRNGSTVYPFDLNKIVYDLSGVPKTNLGDSSQNGTETEIQYIMAMPKFKLVVADSAKGDRVGLGSALQLEDNTGLFAYQSARDKPDINVYLVTLYNHTLNLYMSKNKELIRMTDIQYSTGNTLFINGLPGVITYDGVIIYENPGVTYNAEDFTLRRVRGGNTKYVNSEFTGDPRRVYKNVIPFANYVQFPCYDTYFYESKQFNNVPQAYIFPTNKETGDTKSTWAGALVEPKNSIDLFSNPQGSADDFNIKKYSNYREDVLSVEDYDKTVRRSNVIQDESRVNAWRTFPVEGYKNITENKGIITNLIGIGTYLLVHTQHSLFMFNGDSTLKTEDKDIQLSQPDAFETNYVEVFTSDHGYGGLQDDLSFVVDQFGYIFYNNDFRQLFQFDNGKLNVIDQDITLWLKKINAKNVRFANDKFNKRILIKFDYTDGINADVLSYHYDNGGFVSLHDYYFTEAFNTKIKLYMLSRDFNTPNNNDKVYTFNEQDGYGIIPIQMRNTKTPSKKYNTNNNTFGSYINIIINSEYEVIKLIEFIKYKLRKVAGIAKEDFTYSPVEKQQTPYAGDIIRIFNDICDSGDIDVSVNIYNPGDYKKPWFELGNWNFNYFRNNINKPNPTAKDIYTRLYGNFFVIEFRFNNIDNLRIEFENIDGSVVKNRQL